MTLKRHCIFFSSLIIGFFIATNSHAANNNRYQALGSHPAKPISATKNDDSLFADHSQHYYNYHKPVHVGLWLTAGIGYGAAGHFAGSTGTATINYRYDDDYYALFSTAMEGTGSVDFPTLFTKWGANKRLVRNLGFLHGTVLDYDNSFATYAYGLSVARGRESTAKKQYTTIGIPFQAQYVWKLGQYFGVGLKGFANLNGRVKQSNIGGALEFSFGKFK